MNRRRACSIVGGLLRLAIVIGALAVFGWFCVRQASAQPINVLALTTAMSRDNDAGCVHEQIGRPFFPYRGDNEAFDHGGPDCPPSEQLNQHMTWSNSPCSRVLFAWAQSIEDAWEPWCTLLWDAEGSLRRVEVMGCRRETNPNLNGHGQPLGQWATDDGYLAQLPAVIAGAPTWEEFRAGEPISVSIDWCTANDWIILGSEYSRIEVFIAAHGFHPMDAVLDVEIFYFADVDPMLEDAHGLFGGWVSTQTTVRPNPSMANFNRDPAVDVADIFCFIAAWFAGDSRAGACDAAGGCTTEDIFAFLTSWFAGE